MSLTFGQKIELTTVHCCNFPVSLLVAQSNGQKLYARCTRCSTIYPTERIGEIAAASPRDVALIEEVDAPALRAAV